MRRAFPLLQEGAERLLCAESSLLSGKRRETTLRRVFLPTQEKEKRLLCAESSFPLREKRGDYSAQSLFSLPGGEAATLRREALPALGGGEERLLCAESLLFFGRECCHFSHFLAVLSLLELPGVGDTLSLKLSSIA